MTKETKQEWVELIKDYNSDNAFIQRQKRKWLEPKKRVDEKAKQKRHEPRETSKK